VSLEQKLLAWAKGAGKERVQQAAMEQVNEHDLSIMAHDLANCIESVIPPALAKGFAVSPSVSKSGDGTCSISLTFLNKERPSFTNGPVYDIYGLFTQGWSYDPPAPRGLWHGNWIRARASYVGQAFVESGVDAWKGSVKNGIEVKDISINPLYT